MSCRTNTIDGTYGSNETPCQVFTYECPNGLTWYAVEGSQNVNATYDTLTDGIDVETLHDVDIFTWPDGIADETELETAVDA